MIKQFFRDPLLHFLLAGAALYFLADAGSATTDADTIEVTTNSLLPYLAKGDPRLTVADAPAYLQRIDPRLRDDFIEEYIREEVLVREAKALGLDQEDAFLRQRLVSRLQYINEAFGAETKQISETDLQDWYQQHKELYRLPERISFTHVFVARDPNNPEAARTRAATLRTALNEQRVSPHRGPALGDRFLYHRNYVSSERQEIESHFGAQFATPLFDAEPGGDGWQGPWQSDHGWHAVFLSGKTASRVPPLAELERRIREDIAAEREYMANRKFYEEARSKYRIIVNLQSETTDAD